MWLVSVVGFFYGQIWLNTDGPLCTRCAPGWTTALGRVLYVLLAICIALTIWKFATQTAKDVTPNNRLLSDASAALRACFSAPNPGR
jgi:hypothetical protein